MTYYVWLPVLGKRSSLTKVADASDANEALAKAGVKGNYVAQTLNELPKFMKTLAEE